jgi:hypothetical protein
MALMVYREHGAGKMAIVTERNLTRAERQIDQSTAQRQGDPLWAQSFNIADTSDSFDWQAFLTGSSSGGDGPDGSPGGFSQVA